MRKLISYPCIVQTDKQTDTENLLNIMSKQTFTNESYSKDTMLKAS